MSPHSAAWHLLQKFLFLQQGLHECAGHRPIAGMHACYSTWLYPLLSCTVSCACCSRAIVIHAHVLTEATAVMVVDHKGRLVHATAKLSMLLGHPVANLTKMKLNALLPQPICQMHGACFKVGGQQ